MSLFKQFKTDNNLEKGGINVDYGPNADLPAAAGGEQPHIIFRVARSGGANVNYTKAMERLARPFKKAIQHGSLSNEQAKQMDRTAFLETCLLGWENVTGPDGAPLEFNRANAEMLFSSLPDLYDDLREQANNSSLYREELREADLGNSGRSLNTDSSKGQ